MSASSPEEYALDVPPLLVQTNGADYEDDVDNNPWTWTPMCHRTCSFRPDDFDSVMQNLVRNPNILSSWLFRADLVYVNGKITDAAAAGEAEDPAIAVPASPQPCFAGLDRVDDRTIVRRLVPRNTKRDKSMLQTCLFYESDGHEETEAEMTETETSVHRSLVVYLPHIQHPADVPFYHPKVRGVGFLHEWNPLDETGTLSVHFSFFPPLDENDKNNATTEALDSELVKKLSRPILNRVALSLLSTVHKHGEGRVRGYVKRVHHDQLVPQARVQDRYTQLKAKYARRLVDTWMETTDPMKHVFEDLAIAAFLIELWADMYGSGGVDVHGVPLQFPGFVDVGCGNGLLVHLLHEEGYRGWGFDARERKSWAQYNGKDDQGNATIQAKVLVPFFLDDDSHPDGSNDDTTTTTNNNIQDGRFPSGTFIIANHADELTVWTPVLAALNGCPFVAIPCCSHNFTGSRFRASPPSAERQALSATISSSTYGSFVEWVVDVANGCGWNVEREMLRIPSTRNAALIGRTRRNTNDDDDDASKEAKEFTIDDARNLVWKFGGAGGFAANAAKLATKKSSGH